MAKQPLYHVLALTLLASALRLYRLDGQGLWSDEGYTVLYARLPLGALLAEIARVDPHPPLYYLAVKLWTSAAGDSDFALRYLSVAAATLTVPALALLVRRVAGWPAGLVAAALLAANPFAVWYAQEARMYAPLGLLATIATLRLQMALERGSGRAWLLHALSLALAIHTHYYALALAGWHAYLTQRAVIWRPDRLRAVGAFLLVGLAFLPWWLSARALDYGGWMPHVGLAEAARRAAWAFAVGTSIYPEYGWPLAAPTLAAAALGCLLLLAWRRGGSFQTLAGWAVGPLLAAWLFGALTGRASFHERYVSLGAPALLALAGVGIAGAFALSGRLARAARRELASPRRAPRHPSPDAGTWGTRRVGRRPGDAERAPASADGAAAASPLPLGAGLPGPTGPGKGQGEGGKMGGAAVPASRCEAGAGRLAAWARAALGLAAAGAAASVGGALLVGALAADARSLAWHFGDPHFSKENVRAAAEFMAPRASPDDLLIGAPGRLWLYERYGRVTMPTLETDVVWSAERLAAELTRTTSGRRRVWMLPAGADVERDAEQWLDERAYRLDERWFGLAPVKSWIQLADPPGRSAAAWLGAAGAPTLDVAQAAVALDDTPPLRTIRVIGRWRKLRETASLKESIRLVDAGGRTAAQVDRPLGGEVRPIEGWPIGAEETIRSALRVAPDLPGGRYAVRLVVYDQAGPLTVRAGDGGPAATEWVLGEIDLRPAGPAQAALVEPARADDRALGALRLIGYDLPAGSVPAGGTLAATLHWQAIGPNAFGPAALGASALGLRPAPPIGLPTGAPARLARLLRAAAPPPGGEWAGPAPGLSERASADPGALLRDVREIRVPRGMRGRYEIVLLVAEQTLPLGSAEVTPAPPPAVGPAPERALDARFEGATLVGLDLAGDPRPGGRVTLSAHWRAEAAGSADLAVFVHLIGPDGKIAAQHDGRPCGGGCPTTAWAPGDELLDAHPVELPAALAPGRYRLAIGLYDPRSGVRRPRAGAPAGEPDFALADAFELPP